MPVGTTTIVCFHTHWDSAANTFDSLTVGSTGVTLTLNTGVSGDLNSRTCGVIGNWTEGAGTTSLAWSYSSGTPDEGGCLGFVYLSGAETSGALNAVAGTSWTDTATNGVTIDSNATDVVVGMVESYDPDSNPNGAPAGAGQTVLLDNAGSFNSETVDIASEDTPGASTTTFTGTGHYGCVIACSILESTGGGGGLAIPIAAYHYNHNVGSKL